MKVKGLIVWGAMMAMAIAAQAEDNHYFGIALEGAYATMHPYQVNVDRIHGYAGGGTLLYEYQHNHFLMDIGAGFVWERSGWQVPGVIKLPEQTMEDSEGDIMTLHTQVKRWDEVRRGFVDIPLLFGGEWGRGYVLGGLKVGIGVYEKSQLKGSVTTTATYDQYFVPFSEMANHGLYTDEPLEKAYKPSSEIDLRASIEAGVNLANVETPANASIKVRLGAFVDYGFFFAKVDDSKKYLTHEGTQLDLSTYQMYPILTKGSNLLDNLLAGIKLTVLIGAPGAGSSTYCPSCHILDDRWQPIHYKKGCVICEHDY